MLKNMTRHNNKMIDHLATIIQQDPGNRGFASHITDGHLAEAAQTLLGHHRILILTGFCVLESMTGETDGPPGALVIGSALKKLGKAVGLVTDQYSSELLKAGLNCFEEEMDIYVIASDQETADREMRLLLNHFKPDHMIAIERPGKAQDGHSYSMRGEKLNQVIPQLDLMFSLARQSGIVTTAIGDGGNELGMGAHYLMIQRLVPRGTAIGCVTPADLVIPAGVSNWAAYGLSGALSLLSGNLLMPSIDTEERVLESMVSAGAVDGCTKKREISVDGLPFTQYLKVIDDIIRYVHMQMDKIP